jgi:hypothetical protein
MVLAECCKTNEKKRPRLEGDRPIQNHQCHDVETPEGHQLDSPSTPGCPLALDYFRFAHPTFSTNEPLHDAHCGSGTCDKLYVQRVPDRIYKVLRTMRGLISAWH